jgi:hypothetical protein
MFDYMLRPQGLNVLQVPELSQNLHGWVESPFMRGVNLFQPIPRYLMDNLLFPYVYGFDLVVQLKQRGGWKFVDRSYQNPPVSTEQVIHPEKYLDAVDLPTLIALPETPDLLNDWQEIERNTLGEFNIRILLNSYLPPAAAEQGSAGWDGDRFALFEHIKTTGLFVAWLTAWDSENESQEFFHKAGTMLQKRYADIPLDEQFEKRLHSAKQLTWATDGGVVILERRGPDVLLLDGIPEGESEALRAHFWNSRIDRRE